MATVVLENFAGGLNLRESPNQLQLSESPSCLNVVITERGGLKRRNGCQNAVALPGTTTTKAYIFYSAALDLFLCARESGGALHLFSRPGNLGGAWTDRGTINTNPAAQAAFVDFPKASAGGPVVVIATDLITGATNGIWTIDGAFALTNVSSTATTKVAGNAIALWQNKVWVAGFPTSNADGNPTTLRWCDAGDPATWTLTNVQQFRSLDAKALTGLGVAGGALIVFKKRSMYRVTDSTTGSFFEIDTAVGAGNPRAIAALRGRLYFWGADGIYASDGSGPAINVGDVLRPLYYSGFYDAANVTAGIFEDHVIFSVPVTSNPSEIYDYSPSLGAFVKHQIVGNFTNISSFTSKEATLYGAVSDGDSIYSMFTGTGANMGKDASTGYSGGWFTPWFLPNSGMLTRLQLVRLQGLIGSALTMLLNVYKDWDPSVNGQTFDVSAPLRSTTGQQASAAVRALGHAESFQLQLGFTGDSGAGTDLSLRSVTLVDVPVAWPVPGYPKRAPTTPPDPYGRKDGRGPPPSPSPKPLPHPGPGPRPGPQPVPTPGSPPPGA